MLDRRITAFRAWRLPQHGAFKLRSTTQSTEWPTDGPFVASCKCGWWRAKAQPMYHQAPAEAGGSCGIHAVYVPDALQLRAFNSEINVLGVVALWGIKEFHELGMRAQYAKPLALFDHLDRGLRPERPMRMKQVAYDYGIPIIAPAYALDFASEHGEIVDPTEFAPKE